MASAYSNRADAYHELGEYESAIADYRKALTFDARNDSAYHNLGLLTQRRAITIRRFIIMTKHYSLMTTNIHATTASKRGCCWKNGKKLGK